MKTTIVNLVFAAASIAVSSAQTIVFDGPQRIFNQDPVTQLLTDGTFVLATNVGGGSGGISVTVDTDTPEGSLTFSAPSVSGSTESLTNNGVTLDVTPDNTFTTRSAASYSNNSDMETLVSSLAISDASNTPSARITLDLSGLTVGYEYRLQLIHFDPGVDPNAREMTLSNADNLSNNSGVFTYFDTATSSALNAVRMTATWTADATTQSLYLDGTGSFERSVLNGAALHITAIPEPGSAAAFAAIVSLLLVLGLRMRRNTRS